LGHTAFRRRCNVIIFQKKEVVMTDSTGQLAQ